MQQVFGMGEENIPTLKTNFSLERGQPNRLRNYERKQPDVGENAKGQRIHMVLAGPPRAAYLPKCPTIGPSVPLFHLLKRSLNFALNPSPSVHQNSPSTVGRKRVGANSSGI